MTYRIKEHKNKITGESKYTLQIKFLWWWNTCYRELGWGCDEPMIFDTREECEEAKREREIDDAWSM